jgi:hypothetical protein
VRRASARTSWLAALVPLITACISTEITDHRNLPVCALQLEDPHVGDAIVQINVDAPGLFTFCNGTAIAPNLVLTEANCVAVPYVEFDFTLPSCRHTGAPVEDGTFEFRYSQIADPSTISLRGKTEPLPSMVGEVFVSRASSPCSPDIALLRVQPELDVPDVLLRLEGGSPVDEKVTVSGFELGADSPELHETEASITEATSEVGSKQLPPSSLLLSGNACTAEGGAVFDRSSSALLGVIQQSDLTISCAPVTSHPIALQLAPFREFLLETASHANAELLSERRPHGTPGQIPDCPE